MKWPNNKDFAFTIIDDTDNATVKNVKPIYDLLYDLGLKTTKTVWVYSPRDRFTGQCLLDKEYLDFILDINEKGFEIALHGIGSGKFTREEILQGLQIYKKFIGNYPKMHINHAQSPHNLFWGNRGNSKLLQAYARLRSPQDCFYGEKEHSEYFWGDWVKENIKYIRSRCFNDINTLKQDPLMPYRDKDKDLYSNFWFSSSNGSNLNSFVELISEDNVMRLKHENGLCIVYTHFASGFVNDNDIINQEFKNRIVYLASQNGWFVPASEMLNYLLENKKEKYASELYFTSLDIKKKLLKK